MKNTLTQKLLIIFLIFALSSCAKKEETPTGERNYVKAKKLLDDKNYSEAAKEFEKIDDDFPFSKWAVRAKNMAAYAFFKNQDYAEVIRVADDFLRVHPSDKTTNYMYYMKALSYYEQIPEITRSQDNTRFASASFRELIARFPNSIYAEDAREKLIFVDEHIAGAKMSVGRYQVFQQNYVGALKNFQEVVMRYSHTNQAPEAYYRLLEIYTKIGLKKEAEIARSNLELNFFDNQWALKAKEIIVK